MPARRRSHIPVPSDRQCGGRGSQVRCPNRATDSPQRVNAGGRCVSTSWMRKKSRNSASESTTRSRSCRSIIVATQANKSRTGSVESVSLGGTRWNQNRLLSTNSCAHDGIHLHHQPTDQPQQPVAHSTQTTPDTTAFCRYPPCTSRTCL